MCLHECNEFINDLLVVAIDDSSLIADFSLVPSEASVLLTFTNAHVAKVRRNSLVVRNTELITFDDLIALNQFGSCKKNLPTYNSSPLLVNDEHRRSS